MYAERHVLVNDICNFVCLFVVWKGSAFFLFSKKWKSDIRFCLTPPPPLIRFHQIFDDPPSPPTIWYHIWATPNKPIAIFNTNYLWNQENNFTWCNHHSSFKLLLIMMKNLAIFLMCFNDKCALLFLETLNSLNID